MYVGTDAARIVGPLAGVFVDRWDVKRTMVSSDLLRGAVVIALVFAGGLWAVYGSGTLAEESHPSLAFLTRGWVTPSGTDLALLAACGLMAAVGLTLLTHAYRIAPSSA